MRWSSVVAGLVVLIAASVIAALVVNSQDAGGDKPGGPPQDDLVQRRKDFMERVGEAAGIVDVKGTTVTVGPKFHATDAGHKEVTLSMLAAHVFELPENGSLQPGQTLTLIDAKTGKRVGATPIAASNWID